MPTTTLKKKLLLGLISWIVALIVLPGLILAAFEVGLRMKGVGEDRSCLRTIKVGEEAFYVPNKAFYQQFSAVPMDHFVNWDELDFQCAQEKGPDEYRVVVLGGSAAFGKRSIGRIFEALVRGYESEKTISLFNLACPGMNSHVMAEAARACTPLQPDLFVVYMGNNEFIGPYGPTTSLAQHPLCWNPIYIRTHIFLSRLRIFQWLSGSGMAAWHIPDEAALFASRPQQSADTHINRHYRHNLEAICATAEKTDAEIILCTLASNRCFDETPEQPLPPLPVPLQERTPTNQVILDVAKEKEGQGVFLADTESALVEQSPRHRPGYDFFLDNIHFSFNGAHIVADTIFGCYTSRHPATKSMVLDRTYCARALAWGEAAEYYDLQFQLQAYFDPTSRERLVAKEARFSTQSDAAWNQAYLKALKNALEAWPSNTPLWCDYYELQRGMGKIQEALQAAQANLERFPQNRTHYRYAGRFSALLGNQKEAVLAFQQGLRLYPDDHASAMGLAKLWQQQGQVNEARVLFEQLLRADPMDTEARCSLGDLYLIEGEVDKAEACYRETIALAPNDGLAPHRLQTLLNAHADLEKRNRIWTELASAHPESASIQRCLGDIRMEKSDSAAAMTAYTQAVKLNPFDPANHAALARAYTKENELSQAIVHYEKALSINSAFSYVLVELAQLYYHAGDLSAARDRLRQSIEKGHTPPAALIELLSEE